MTRFVERSFHLDTEAERDEWIKAYSDVKKKVMLASASAPIAANATDALSAGSSASMSQSLYTRLLSYFHLA